MVTRKPPLVLLTAYNGTAYLPAQLSSLCAQSVSFTAILRDDGSADDTPALLAAQCHQDARFRLSPTSGVHLGAVGGFFALMREAADSGAPVALCDQDDIWHPDKLTRLHDALSDAEARFGADTPILVHSDARIVDAYGRPLHSSLWRHQGWNPAAQSLPELLVQNNVTGCLLMMNAPLCRLCAQHQPTGDLHMHDWFIALTAAAFGRIIPIPAALADYRHGCKHIGASPPLPDCTAHPRPHPRADCPLLPQRRTISANVRRFAAERGAEGVGGLRPDSEDEESDKAARAKERRISDAEQGGTGGDDVVWVMRCLFRVLFTTFPCAHREIGVK